jgi:hypothetical protein
MHHDTDISTEKMSRTMYATAKRELAMAREEPDIVKSRHRLFLGRSRLKCAFIQDRIADVGSRYRRSVLSQLFEVSRVFLRE